MIRRARLLGLVTPLGLLALIFSTTQAGSQSTPTGVQVPTFEQYRALEARVAALEARQAPTTLAPATTVVPTTSTSTPVCAITPVGGQTAITAAIAGCPNGSTVRFPAAASYTITGPIVVDSRADLTIDGNGSTFHNAAPNDATSNPAWRLRLDTNLTLTNLTVEGGFHPSSTRVSPEGVNLRATNQFNAAVAVFGGAGIRLEAITTRNVWGDPVLVVHSDSVLPGDPGRGSQASDVVVAHLDATTHTRQCVAVASVQTFYLSDSTCRDSWYGGVDFELDPNVVGHTIHDAHVIGSTFDGAYFYAIAVPVTNGHSDTVGGIEVRDNHITAPPDTCRSPIIIKAVEDTSAGSVADVNIVHNDLKTLYNGIELTDVTTGAVTDNAVTITVAPGYCGPPAGVPVKATRSPVTVSGTTSSGY